MTAPRPGIRDRRADVRRARRRSRRRPGRRSPTSSSGRTWHARPRRSATSGPRVVAERADWEELRLAGAAIKDEVLARPAGAARAARGARDRGRRDRPLGARRRRGERDRRVDSSATHGATEVVKVKSMATQEIELNEALAPGGHRRLGDRPRRADRPARPRPAVAHPRPGDPPQPGRDPRHLHRRDGPGRAARRRPA